MFLLFALAAGPALAAPPFDPGTIISADLPGHEQAAMRGFVRQLAAATLVRIARRDPAQVDITVIDAAVGKTHVNRPETADDMSAAGKNYNPGVTLDTGPYRRVYTHDVPAIPSAEAVLSSGAYFTAGDVSIDCAAGSFNMGAGEGGYIYLGGWSGTPTVPYANVDAGLQYNLGLTAASGDDYSPFMSVAGADGKYVQGPFVKKVTCSRTHATAHLTFLVYGCYTETTATDCLELDVDPPPPDHFQAVIYAIPVTTPQSAGPLPGGWGDTFLQTEGSDSFLIAEAPCGRCVFKWMTSIAQKPANYSDGATYGATWSNRAISCRVRGCTGDNKPTPLLASELACSENPVWFNIYQFGHRDCTNTPTGQTGLAQSVTVTGYSPVGETDAISLTYTP